MITDAECCELTEARNIEQAIRRAERHCSKQGIRLTLKRKLVLSTLLKSDKALSAHELADTCKKELGETLSTMSIYRMLDFFTEKNLAHKLGLANKYVACEHINCDHNHGIPQFLICKSCSKVKEIFINQNMIQELQAYTQNSGFKMVSPQLEMSCYCEECLKEKCAT